MATNEYSLESMRSAADVMGETSAAIKGDLTKLSGILQQLEVSWSSDASKQMGSTMERWDAAQNRLLESLAQIQHLMGQTAQKFGINEEEQRVLMNVSVDYDYTTKL